MRILLEMRRKVWMMKLEKFFLGLRLGLFYWDLLLVL